MIFVTGDIHGTHSIEKLNTINFPEQKTMTKNDYVIILGDFGLIWNGSKEEEYWLNWLNNKNFTTLFIDGNHECISKDSDILTESGWINIEEAYNLDYKIANYDIKTKTIRFNNPIKKIKSFKEKCIFINGKNTKQKISLDHEVIVNEHKIKAKNLLGNKIKECAFDIRGNSNNKNVEISDNMIRIITWIICDGTIIDYSKYNSRSNKCTIQFKLSEERKIKRLSKLLEDEKIKYTIKKSAMSGINKKQPYCIRIYADEARKLYNTIYKTKQIPNIWKDFSKDQTNIFLEELQNTDGRKIPGNTTEIKWTTINKRDVDIVQAMCIKNNIYFRYIEHENASGFSNGKKQYICSIFSDKKLNKYVNVIEEEYNDYMYCFQMPLGTLITRLNGCVAFTGNCFDRLYKYPTIDFLDGKTHKIADSIYHLMRGEIFIINGIKFFVFGGGISIDKAWRIEGSSWWPQEIPSYSEIENGFANLEKYNNTVDIVLTHAAPTIPTISIYSHHSEEDEVTKILDQFENKIICQKWYFGHHHIDKIISDKYQVLYNDFVVIE